MSTSTLCKGCGVPIVWALSPRRAKFPLVKVKTVYGLVGPAGARDLPTAVHVDWEPGMSQDVYVSHFETCPKAWHFSGRNKGT